MEKETASKSFDEWILLNVGGEYIQTTRSTLTKDPQSMLGKMFSSETDVGYKWSSLRDDKGAFLIDQDPRYFREGI